MPDISELSERELEILELVATGASNKEIARDLHISSNTVKVHLRNIFSKLEVNSRTEAAMIAISHGLLGDIPLPGETPIEEEEPETDEDDELETGPAEVQPAGTEAPAVAPARRPYWLYVLGLAVLGILVVGLAGIWPRNSAGQAGQEQPLSPAAATMEAARWQTMTEMPTARSSLAVATYESTIIAIGGETPGGVTGVVERYDLSEDTWSRLADKPTPVSEIGAALIGGKVYVPGGRLANGELTRGMEVYVIRSGAWESGPDLPVALSAYAVAAFEGKLFLFGGWDGSRFTNDVYQFDPGSGDWETRSPMPTARGWAGAAAAMGRIYVIGGYDGQTALDANEVYAPGLDAGEDSAAWSEGAPLPEPRYAMGVANVADFIHVLGGVSDDEPGSPFALYFIPQSNQWEASSSTSEHVQPALSRMGVAAISPRIFVLGGLQDDEYSRENLAYQAVFTLAIPAIAR